MSIRILNPKKRIENAYTQSGRIAKLRLSECSANSFEHCRTRAVYLNSPERPEQSSFSSILLRQVVREIEWGSKKMPPSTNDWVVMKGKVNLSNRHAIHANLIGLFLSFAHIGERSEHKTIATLLRKESPRDSLMGRGYLSDRASGCERLHPFPWRGEGPWVGVEAPSYEEGVGVDGTSKPKAWLPKKSRWNIQTIGLA